MRAQKRFSKRRLASASLGVVLFVSLGTGTAAHASTTDGVTAPEARGSGFAVDIAINSTSTRAFVAQPDSSLEIFDISTSTPQHLESIPILMEDRWTTYSANARSVALSLDEQIVYVGASGFIAAVDVSQTPAQVLGYEKVAGIAIDLAVSSDGTTLLAPINAGNGIAVFKLDDPDSFASSTSRLAPGENALCVLPTTGHGHNIIASPHQGDHRFLAISSLNAVRSVLAYEGPYATAADCAPALQQNSMALSGNSSPFAFGADRNSVYVQLADNSIALGSGPIVSEYDFDGNIVGTKKFEQVGGLTYDQKRNALLSTSPGGLTQRLTTMSADMTDNRLPQFITADYPSGRGSAPVHYDSLRDRVIMVGADGATIEKQIRLVIIELSDLDLSPAVVTLEEGDTATFTASTTHSPQQIIWEASSDNGVSWQSISGATGPTLTLPDLTTDQSGTLYRSVMLDYGLTNWRSLQSYQNSLYHAASEPALLTVNAAAPAPDTTEPEDTDNEDRNQPVPPAETAPPAAPVKPVLVATGSPALDASLIAAASLLLLGSITLAFTKRRSQRRTN